MYSDAMLVGAGGKPADTEDFQDDLITQKGGKLATWWSYPLREEHRAVLEQHSYVYVYRGREKRCIPLRYRVVEWRSSAGNAGLECPKEWESHIESATWKGMTRLPERERGQAGIFKTWFLIDHVETLDPEIPLDKLRELDGQPAKPRRMGFSIWRRSKCVIKDPPPRCEQLRDLAKELLLEPSSTLEEFDQLIQSKRQLVFYGPPGTGKTYTARKFAEFLAGGADRVELVQFHPSYAYEDFVEGYRPNIQNGQAVFELKDGVLKRMAERARADSTQTYVMVIDELNRGNLPKVMGELYYLLEYRDQAVRLQYSAANETFSLPDNLWFLCTMNTADRSIALVDAALRRRFYFIPFFPDQPPIQGLLRRWLERRHPNMLWVADVVDRANARLGDRHGQIGPSHFMTQCLDDDWVTRIWNHAIMPYLEEQHFGDQQLLDGYKLDRLRSQLPGSAPGAEGSEDADA